MGVETSAGRIYIGTAGWSVPRASTHRCPGPGTHLERYARVFPCAEINSSFYQPHAAATYARWRDCTPEHFRFATKLPRAITHDLRLQRTRAPLATFLEQSAGLGEKRGPLLVQLPPSLSFDARVATRFFEVVRQLHDGVVVCEPRHPSWFSARPTELMQRFRIARVAADPPPAPAAAVPDGWPGIRCTSDCMVLRERKLVPVRSVRISRSLPPPSVGFLRAPTCGVSSTTRRAARRLRTPGS